MQIVPCCFYSTNRYCLFLETLIRSVSSFHCVSLDCFENGSLVSSSILKRVFCRVGVTFQARQGEAAYAHLSCPSEVRVGKSRISGSGVFANVPLPPGTAFGPYMVPLPFLLSNCLLTYYGLCTYVACLSRCYEPPVCLSSACLCLVCLCLPDGPNVGESVSLSSLCVSAERCLLYIRTESQLFLSPNLKPESLLLRAWNGTPSKRRTKADIPGRFWASTAENMWTPPPTKWAIG